MKILRSDSHISSAPPASMNQSQNPKGQNPLRLPFASFRLILRLEKTAGAQLSRAAGAFADVTLRAALSFFVTLRRDAFWVLDIGSSAGLICQDSAIADLVLL
jgi:hypothetical protein